jgi:hypothetical protein
MILGSIEQLADEAAACQAIAAIRLDLNHGDAWLKTRSTAVSELAAHYQERELEPDTIWKTHSTKVTYEGYLNKWILPRWGKYPLVRVNAGEVELWLRSLPLDLAILGTKHKDDFEPYWQDEKDLALHRRILAHR